ncbi:MULTISPECIES: FecR family protein [unclassified Sphingobacterium]|uniref:FecR family protein n=1 Tax=unclassified Sphingobacterium TaxID=2609468 RepID=UPI001AE7F31E|nr:MULTISPECIES: FecR domain-containing protein [unclassified Sphingobacterium]MDR6735691.1 ferric-dicitrate binding protein FerR (iron transport regulator) [Sphingobacterium sp. 2149]
MKRRIFESLIYKYQQNKADKAERSLIDHWYDTLDRQEIPEGEVDEDRLWNRIEQCIIQTKPKKSVIRKLSYWSGAVAASMLLCFGVLFWKKQQDLNFSRNELNLKPGYRIFETGASQRKRVLLVDGSIVVMNAYSKIKLDTVSYDRKDRVVELLAGEAYFEVKKDSTKAFIVNARQIQTKVLGTSFTVKNYAELDDISVSVFTGKVQVIANNNPLGVLTRGEQIRYTKNNHNSNQETFDLTTRNSWMEGRVYLKQSSFAELALAVKNIYDVDIKTDDQRIAQQRYSMPISKQLSWTSTLESIKAIHYNKSRKEGRIVHIY